MLEKLPKKPKKGKVPRSIGPICRKLLNDLRNLTFLVENKAEVLHTVKEKLEEIRAMLRGSIKTIGATKNTKKKKKNYPKISSASIEKEKEIVYEKVWRVEVYQKKRVRYQRQ